MLFSYFVVYGHFTSPGSHTAATVGRVTSHGKALDFILNDGIISEVRSRKSEIRSQNLSSALCLLSSVFCHLSSAGGSSLVARVASHGKADDSPCCACYSAKRCEARAAQQSRKGRLAAEEKEYCIEEGTTRPELCQSRKGPLSGGRSGERAADVHCIGSRGPCKRKG